MTYSKLSNYNISHVAPLDSTTFSAFGDSLKIISTITEELNQFPSLQEDYRMFPWLSALYHGINFGFCHCSNSYSYYLFRLPCRIHYVLGPFCLSLDFYLLLTAV
jgi:hypothetical protein